MHGTVMVLDTDENQCQGLCALIEHQGHYRALPQKTLPEMEALIRGEACGAVVIDIDSVPIDNKTIRLLTCKYPGVAFLYLSSKKYHPELQEALSHHIYACINKPVDPEELHYLIRSIFANSID